MAAVAGPTQEGSGQIHRVPVDLPLVVKINKSGAPEPILPAGEAVSRKQTIGQNGEPSRDF